MFYIISEHGAAVCLRCSGARSLVPADARALSLGAQLAAICLRCSRARLLTAGARVHVLVGGRALVPSSLRVASVAWESAGARAWRLVVSEPW